VGRLIFFYSALVGTIDRLLRNLGWDIWPVYLKSPRSGLWLVSGRRCGQSYGCIIYFTVECCCRKFMEVGPREEQCPLPRPQIVSNVKKVGRTRLPSIGFRSWSRFLAVSLQVTGVINPAVGWHYFPPGLQLPLQPLRGLLPVSLLGEQRHDGCEQFA